MARKGTSPPSSNESDMQPTDRSTRIKVQKDKIRVQMNHDADASDSYERSPKRVRVNSQGVSATPPTPSHSHPLPPFVNRPRHVPWTRDQKGYIPGSIVRVQLKNFVTYDYVEFTPGPFLNMIIGPNGTGKSSIACGIALGLNYPPSILGRAAELMSFVKNDTSEGYIEIELKGKEDGKNFVIKRLLSATQKNSPFFVNGKPATGKEVNKVMTDLSIQVGNLCSFLPQDKVSSFAAMSAQELLRETQRAAGDENLSTWHETLISAGKELRELNEKITHESSTLQQMIERNEGIERDVQRFKERQKIEQEIDKLGVLIPTQRYRDAYGRYQTAKVEQRRLHVRVKKLKNINAPAHAKLAQWTKELAAIEKKHAKQKDRIVDHFNKLKSVGERGEELDRLTEKQIGALEAIDKAEKARKEKIVKLEKELERLEQQLTMYQEEGKEKQWEEELGVLTAEMRVVNIAHEAAEAEYNRYQQEMEEHFDRLAQAKRARHVAQEELQNLDQQSSVKLQSLARWNKDTADAIMWLRGNRGKFEKEIFEPSVISVDVQNKAYVDQVEGCFPRVSQTTFVAQTQHDADLLNRSINDEQGLGRTARISVWFRPNNGDERRAPVSPDQIRAMGFDGYAMDFIKYPPGMDFYLRSEVGLHTIAITLNPQNVDIGNAMKVYGDAGGGKFIVGRVFSNTIKSAYGRREVSNMTSDLANARNFIQHSIDPTVRHNIKQRYDEKCMEVMELEGMRAQFDQKAEVNNKKREEVGKQRQSIRSKQHKISAQKKEKIALSARITRSKESLAAELKAEPVDAKRARIQKEITQYVVKRVRTVGELRTIAHDIIRDQTQNARLGMQVLQLTANRNALDRLCKEKDERYQKAVLEFAAADEQFRAAKGEAQEANVERQRVETEMREDPEKEETWEFILLVVEATNDYYAEVKQASGVGGGGDPDNVPVGDNVDTRTVEALERDLETEQTKLEMNLQTNPGVVEMYEKRKKDIEQLSKTVDERKERGRRKEKDIKNAKDNWYPALHELVTSIGRKFSAAFDRIGCAGEIRIHEDEDFEKWAIDIMVKFRDTEKLQLLTAQRQSGGERSLTTILYLMSLSEEARAPFSLVDEINQGMDQRAERMVHNSLVDVTCKPESGQYFLITPKLLPDLKYHELMKVLVVNNGEWLPTPEENKGFGNMGTLIEAYVARKGGRRGV